MLTYTKVLKMVW